MAWGQVGAMGVMVLVTALAYRRISVAARLMVVLWVGMLITVVWVIAAGSTHWSAALAFDFPEGAFHVDHRAGHGSGHGALDRDVQLFRLLPGVLSRGRSRNALRGRFRDRS